MPDKNVFDRYLLALRKTKIDEKTEHTDRAALQALLQTFADQSGNGTTVQHEPKRVAEKGAPDFKITSRGLILGYVENKAIGEHLDKVLKSDQIVRYKTLSQNIILTDYLHFIWIGKDGIQRETLCHATDLAKTPSFAYVRIALRPCPRRRRPSFQPRLKASDVRNNLRWRSRHEASCSTIILAKNWCGKKGIIRKGGSMDCSRFSAIRSFMN